MAEITYLGSLFFYKDEEEGQTYIIDGQQRIVTAVIFLSAARKIARELDELDASNHYVSKFYTTVDSCVGIEEEGIYPLHLKGNAQDFFKEYIQKGNFNTEAKCKPCKNIVVVKEMFEQFLKEKTSKCDGQQAKFQVINSFTSCLLTKFLVGTIETYDLVDAYTIFETLNSRGKDLEAADLVKNHIFKQCKDDLEGIKSKWNTVTDKVNGVDDKDVTLTDYIRYYWNSKYPFVREKQLYKKIFEKIKGYDEATAFVSDLHGLYDKYLLMVKPNSDTELFNKDIRNVIAGFNVLDNKIYYPLLLAFLLKGVKNEKIYELLRTVESLTVRNVILGPKRSNSYEQKLSKLAKDFSDGTKTADEVIEEISGMIIDDESLRNSMSVKDLEKAKVIRYLLSQIYTQAYGVELKINPDASEVNLEHVLPQKPDPGWGISDDEVRACVHKLGNMTLLSSSDNSSMSNGVFSEKKKIYANSSIKFNEYFSDKDVWNREAIMKRQDELFEIVIQRWSRTPSVRTSNRC